jgi:sugar phosphate isomerase/epimerase
MPNHVLLGTILLEPNRWAAGRVPTYRVSEWMDRIREAGFDGLELWENHAAMAPEAEIEALCRSSPPVRVFNSYATMHDAGQERRRRAAELVRRLKATGVKFNVGADPGRLSAELVNARSWAAEMPDARLLCECHPGTSLENPETAAQTLTGWPEIAVIVHAFSVPDLELWFRHLGPRILHMHVQLTDESGRRCRLRAQSNFARERLAMMHDLGFAGTFTVEFTEGVGTPPEDQEALFRAAADDLAFLKEHGR